MNTRGFVILIVVVVLLAAAPALHAQAPVGTAFTYQGQLKQSGVAAEGDYDFLFRLYDDPTAGEQVGSDVHVDDWPVSRGLFTVQLDFGSGVFTGNAHWLEVSVRPGDSVDPYTALSPRQPLTPAPYALYALDSLGYWAADGDDIYSTNSGNVGIGTSSPGSPLHIAGGNWDLTNSEGDFKIGNEVYRLKMGVRVSGLPPVLGEARIRVQGGLQRLHLGAGTADVLTVTPDGVGIETTSPTSELDVVGTIAADGLTVDGPVGGTGFSAWDTDASDDLTSSTSFLGDVTGTYDATVVGDDSHNHTDPTIADDISLDNGRLYAPAGAGNVGIGTTTPTSELDVAGTAQMTGFKLTTSPQDGYVLTSDPNGVGTWQAATSSGWSLTGNAGTDPDTHFLGTTDDVGLELRVNNQRALRLEQTDSFPNLIGGHGENSVTAGVLAATISGGGIGSAYANRVTDNFGTVGGGLANQAGDDAGSVDDASSATVAGGSENSASDAATTVGGGHQNSASGTYATVGGGRQNEASESEATVAGGSSNTASGSSATIAGGFSNEASANGATVGGGDYNTASGTFATVPGGFLNVASGYSSFAAGRRAKANHDGAFVWADHTNADFASTGTDQFLIRAAGGVGIGTNDPNSPLTVNGVIESLTGGFKFPDGTVQSTAAAGGITGGGTAGCIPKFTAATVLGDSPIHESAGDIGIGIASPSARLHVAGTVYAEAADEAAVHGLATGSTPDSWGVYGESTCPMGRGVVGYASGTSMTNYGVHGQSDSANGRAVYGYASAGSGANTGVYGTTPSTSGRGVIGYASASSGTTYGVYGKSDSVDGYGGYFHGRGSFSNDLGVGTDTPAERLHVVGNTLVEGTTTSNGADVGVHGEASGSFGKGVYGYATATEPAFNYGGYFVSDGDHGCGVWAVADGVNGRGIYARGGSEGWAGEFNGRVYVSNTTSTNVLQIRGGSDLSERFDVAAVADADAPAPGMLVCIDPKNPGKLIVSTRAYDRTVAGIISGAGGVATGMLMGQSGTAADGEHPVALSGRVYCLADTSHEPITPGDLLTTSDEPGHAMRVTDYERAQGAIIGKAMTSLDSGQGLVLVLVSLQ